MKKTLVLTASFGGGHNATSQAIKEYSDNFRSDYNVEIVDILEYITPVLSKIAGKSYEINAKTFPEVYGWFYDLNNSTEGKLTKNNLSLFYSQFKELIETSQPEYIICVHPVSISNIIKTRKKYGFQYKVVVLVTDYDYHSSWINEEADAFIVASNYMKFRLMDDGIPIKKINVTGIPTSLINKKITMKDEARRILKLKDKTTVLAMGGSFGAGKLKKLMDVIGGSDLDIQIIFIAGKNKRTKRILEKNMKEFDKDFRVLGYTDQVSLYMDASDFLITKPGGLTISEALIKNIPIIINNPIPGQEEENAIYLLNKGIAVRLNKDNEISALLKDLIDDPVRIDNMKEMQKHYSKPNASEDLFNVLDALETI
jgi:processive 1,2-diacylglycerol beta-glucosyltransferase